MQVEVDAWPFCAFCPAEPYAVSQCFAVFGNPDHQPCKKYQRKDQCGGCYQRMPYLRWQPQIKVSLHDKPEEIRVHVFHLLHLTAVRIQINDIIIAWIIAVENSFGCFRLTIVLYGMKFFARQLFFGYFAQLCGEHKAFDLLFHILVIANLAYFFFKSIQCPCDSNYEALTCEVTSYFPKEPEWYNLFNGKYTTSGQKQTVDAPCMKMKTQITIMKRVFSPLSTSRIMAQAKYLVLAIER